MLFSPWNETPVQLLPVHALCFMDQRQLSFVYAPGVVLLCEADREGPPLAKQNDLFLAIILVDLLHIPYSSTKQGTQ